MKRTLIRKSLPDRLDVAETEYDIKRMSAELEYHKSKAKIFEETIKAQQDELDIFLDHKPFRPPEVGVYR